MVPDTDSVRVKQRNALDVVGHGEQVEGTQPVEHVALLTEDGDVAGKGGRVAGDVGDRPRSAGHDRLHDGTAGALARRVEDDQVDRHDGPACEDRPDIAREHPRAGHVCPRVRAGVQVALDQRHAGRATHGVGQEPREQPDAGVQVEHRLPRPRGQEVQHGVDQHLGCARVHLPEAVVPHLEPDAVHGVVGRRAGDQAVVDLDHVVRAVLAHPAPAAGQGDEALPGPPAQSVLLMGRSASDRFDGHLDLQAGQPGELLADHVRLE